jgi:hypothetical protein
MAVSRPVLLVLIGAVLAAAAWFATSGSRSTDSAGSDPAPVTRQAEPKAAAPKQQAAAPKPDAVAAASPAQLARAERAAAAERGVPAKVTRVIDSGRIAVLFFFQPGAADDAATATAVRGVRGQPRVRVFAVPIGDVADYRAVVSGAQVNQAPSVVIATKRGATLVEGFVDRESLIQRVADAR